MTYADWLDVIQAVGDLRAYSQACRLRVPALRS